jgi:hypothetical protein
MSKGPRLTRHRLLFVDLFSLFGAATLQSHSYFIAYSNDKLALKGLVGVMIAYMSCIERYIGWIPVASEFATMRFH